MASAVIAETAEQKAAVPEVPGELSTEDATEVQAPTIFNGISVPPLPDIDGEKFNTTVKDGYWFVKHHS